MTHDTTLQAALEAPERLYLLLKARHIHEANMCRLQAAADSGRE